MDAFFSVILADLRYLAENESMTVAFLRFDRAGERRDLGMLSDIEVGELEDPFRVELDRREASDRERRLARARLARLMGRPEQLPGELVVAEFPDSEPPEYKQVLQEVLMGNPALKAQYARVQAAEARLAAESAAGRPVLSVDLEAGKYARVTGNRHDLRATLELAVPLVRGGEIAAGRQRARAELQAENALLRDTDQRLHQTVLELVQRLEVLSTRVESARRRVANREIALDAARARYDLEMQADLGNNAARLTEAQWNMQKVLYERAAIRATLDALAGKLGAGK
jgi:outer membrane protein TolC